MTNTEELREAIDDLQIRISYQEDTIDEMNRMMAKQFSAMDDMQLEIDRLKLIIQMMKKSPLEGDAASEPPPPHY